MKPDILLINCYQDENIRPLSPKAERELQVFPSLGLGYLSSYLQKYGFKATVLDVNALELSDEDFKTAVAKTKASIAGITSTTIGWPQAVRGARLAKEALPHGFFIAGGPQITLFPKESISLEPFNAGIMGDGEETLLKLARRMESHEDLYSIEGTVVRTKEGVRVNGSPRWIENLSALPHPSYEDLPLDRYRCMSVEKPFFTMISSRGCPYKCAFCTQECSGDRVRFRSPEDVVSEMAFYVEKMGAREIIMFDETFTLNHQRVMEICRLIEKLQLDFRWNIRTRTDTVNGEMLKALKRAGCTGLHMGVESGSERILKAMNKGITLEQIKEAFRLARKEGFVTRGYFMIGYLDEDPETFEKTLDLSLNLDLDWASFSITTPMPKTALFSEAVKRGLVEKDFWEKFTLLQRSPKEIPVLTSVHWDRQGLEAMMKKAFRRFYLRPSVVMKKLKGINNMGQLGDMFRGLGILKAIGK